MIVQVVNLVQVDPNKMAAACVIVVDDVVLENPYYPIVSVLLAAASVAVLPG